MYAVGWSILLGVTAIAQTVESSSTSQNGIASLYVVSSVKIHK